MKNISKLFIIFGILFNCFQNVFAQKTKSKNEEIYSQEKIPYGVGGMDISLSFSRSMRNEFGSYSVLNPDPNSQVFVPVLTYANLAKVTSFSIATGLDLHLPLIYLLASKDESRFRVADDLGLGFTLGSFTRKRKDYFTGEKIPYSDIDPAVGGSISFWAGIQAFYRINKKFDAGVKYYPYYLNFGFAPDGGVYGKGYGLHARVEKLYLDYLLINPWKTDATHPSTYNIKAHYLYKKQNNIFLNIMYNHTQGRYDVATSANIPPEVYNVKSVPGNWAVYQLGWGLMF